jgi:hypothetical protein
VERLAGVRRLVDRGSAASASSDGVWVAIRSSDGALYAHHSRPDGTPDGWTSLGGYLAAAPSMVSDSGSSTVFVEGGDGGLYARSYNGTWASWTALGGALSNSPSVSLGP